MEKKKVVAKTVKKATTKTKKATKPVAKKKTVTKKEKKKGFTLIELLAVIIILGILMIIAIPSVTRYISDSRKSAYVDTAKEIVAGTRNIVNEGKLGMYSTDTTYYIPAGYIKTENASKSPYGEFTQAYVGVTFDGKGYKYYWISVDDAGQGVDNLKLSDELTTDDIVSDLNSEEIENKVKTTGIGNRNNILILVDGSWSSSYQAQHHISENGGVYNGLTYDGELIVTSDSELRNKLDAVCSGENMSDEQLGVSFNKQYSNYGSVTLHNFFNKKANVGLYTTVSVETDAETGDSRVIASGCNMDSTKFSNLDINKFLYNGEPVTRAYMEEIANNRCDELIEILESLDTECIRSLINR